MTNDTSWIKRKIKSTKRKIEALKGQLELYESDLVKRKIEIEENRKKKKSDKNE